MSFPILHGKNKAHISSVLYFIHANVLKIAGIQIIHSYSKILDEANDEISNRLNRCILYSGLMNVCIILHVVLYSPVFIMLSVNNMYYKPYIKETTLYMYNIY